jgi:antitoxin MazE
MEASIIKMGNSRKGWEFAFEKMRAENDDQLLIDDMFDNEIFEEWK